jgi:carboxyl-terminal processing protease
MKTFGVRSVWGIVAALALSAIALAQVPVRPQAQAPVDEKTPKHLLEAAPGANGGKSASKLTKREAGRIAQATGAVLSQGHYRQQKLNDEISRTFFTNYIAALDYSRLIFTQEDVDQFAGRYAESLDDLTKAGDASPAYAIFDLYLQRLQERTTHALALLRKPIDFTVDERFNPQRDKAPWPADQAAAEELWRLRVKYDHLQGRLAKDKPDDILNTLTKRYNRQLKTMKDFDDEEILSLYLTSLANAYDPHSDYMSPSEARQFEISNVKLSLSGIGALLEWDDGYTRIKSLVPGGPAELSKQLKPKDRVVAVAQGDGEAVDVVETRLNKVVELIRGKKGSEVRLTIVPADTEDGSRKIVTLIRDDIKLSDQFAKARTIDLPGADGRTLHLGVIVLPSFYENATRDVERLITRLKEDKVDGLVLDLRRNGGGILDEAVWLTGLFIPEGPVVQEKRANGTTLVRDDEDSRVAWDGPLVVAVSQLSASASEIVAAALQDYGRAVVVGDASTHGKGTVQTLMPLSHFFNRLILTSDAGKLKFTISKFYRVAGGTTQKYGVSPDVAYPSVLDHMDLGESHYPNSLPADRTTPAKFESYDFVQPYLSTLRDRSANRVATNREFSFVLEDIEEMKKRKADPSVSLRESVRLEERDDRKARTAARKKARKELDSQDHPAIREITLESLDKGEPPKLVSAKPAKDEKAGGASSVPVAAGDTTAVASATTAATATIPAADGNDAEDDDAEAEAADAETRLEPQVRETLNILADYLELLSAKGQRLSFEPHTAARNN